MLSRRPTGAPAGVEPRSVQSARGLADPGLLVLWYGMVLVGIAHQSRPVSLAIDPAPGPLMGQAIDRVRVNPPTTVPAFRGQLATEYHIPGDAPPLLKPAGSFC